MNKTDITGKFESKGLKNEIPISIKEGVNNNQIENKIINLFGFENMELNNRNVLSSSEQIAKLEKVKEVMISVKESIDLKLPTDLIEIDLKEAMFLMGEMLGKEVKEDLLNELFSRFCLGK